MKIKFHETQYELSSTPNVAFTHFQATFEKGDNTFDAIATDTLNTDEITVYDGEEVKAIYSGYDKRIALYVLGGNEYVSVEFENTDIQSQIATLTQHLSTIEQTQEQQAEIITELIPYTETKTAYFNESEKTFYNVPEGNISVFFDNYNGQHSVSRVSDRVTVSFDTLTDSTNITISVN